MNKLLLAAVAAVLTSASALADPIPEMTPKAVLSEGGKTLTFVYDTKDYGTKGTDWFSVSEAVDLPIGTDRPWKKANGTVTSVVIDGSFASYRPSNCRKWFHAFEKLTAIRGLANLDVSAATDLGYMFATCKALTELDLSGFDTANVTTILAMFSGCSSLKTIYASSKFAITGLLNPKEQPFADCGSLEGENGMTWSASCKTAEYARLDKPGTAGYFTEKKAWAVWNSTDKIFTFYFGTLKNRPAGTAYEVSAAEALDPTDPGANVAWYAIAANVEKTVVDASFADYRPTRCYEWFLNFKNAKLKSIQGLENLNVSKADHLGYLFGNCSNLEELDLSNFNTANVTGAVNMFANCTALKTIYATQKFTVKNVTADVNMFASCTSLKGGAGTTFQKTADGDRKGYAQLDGGKDAPGYFTAAPVAVHDAATKTLTFLADGEDHAGVGKSVCSVLAAEAQPADDTLAPWSAHWTTTEKVVIDPTFKSHKPKHCGSWFDGFSNLTDITGPENLDVSEATSFYGMFNECASLTVLDLSSFDTAKATSFQLMFANASSLATIYVSSKFVTTGIVGDGGSDMFYGCSSIRGGEGTTFVDSENGRSSKYARLDEAEFGPGYFTAAPVAVFNDTQKSLSFWFDGEDHSSEGTVYSVLQAETTPSGKAMPWFPDCFEDVTTVCFDKSFANYRPKSCAGWFWGFSELLYAVELNNLDVSETTDLSGMFSGCIRLKALDLSGFDTSSVTDFSGMFSGCESLKSIYATEKFAVSGTATSTGMFGKCTDLAGGNGTYFDSAKTDGARACVDGGVTVPGYFTVAPVAVYDSVKKTFTFYADGLDHGGEGLQVFSVAANVTSDPSDPVVPWQPTANDSVEVIFDASFANFAPTHCASWFYGFSKLAKVSGLRSLDLSDAVSLSSMFGACTSLKEIDFSHADTASLKDMSYMFYGCNNLETIYASADFTVGGVTGDGKENVFLGCVKLPGYDAKNVSSDYAKGVGEGGYFTKLEAVAVLSSDKKTLTFYYDGKNHVGEGAHLYYVAQLEEYPGDAAWINDSDCYTNVTKVVFDKSFAEFRPDNCVGWFMNMIHLTAFEGFEYLDVSGCWSLGEMFADCVSLEEIDLSHFDTRGVRNFYGMFWGCRSLKEIDVSGLDTANVEDLSYMFDSCGALTEIDLRTFNTTKVEDMRSMFNNCTNLVSLRIGNFDTRAVESMSAMFRKCESLKVLDLSGFDTASLESMDEMFDCCASLKTIYASSAFTTAGLAVPDVTAFDDCESLVGGKGTSWTDGDEKANRAHLDGGKENPGYFTAAPVAIYDGDDTLTFCCDGADHSGIGKTVYSVLASNAAVADDGDPLWTADCTGTVTTVVFDKSFAAYAPDSCESWFDGFAELSSVQDLVYLDVSEARLLGYLFRDCVKLTELDLSGFDTASCRECDEMFYGCTALTTIYATEKFLGSSGILSSSDMFYGCTKLVGGRGTAYDASKVDKTLAKIDRLDRHGYLTSLTLCLVTFDANGGAIAEKDKFRDVEKGQSIGDLPTAMRPGYDFVGWFTAVSGGYEVNPTTLVSIDATIHAQWTESENPVTKANVGVYLSFDLEKDLGIVIPSDVDFKNGDKVTVKVEGLAKGLKVAATPVYEDPNARKKVTVDYVYTVSGVPTEEIDYATQTMFARVTVTYKDKTKGVKGKAETLAPLPLAIVASAPDVLTEGALSAVYGPIDIATLWPKVADAKKNPKDWSFKTWPAGLKYNNSTKDASWSYRDAEGKTVKTTAAPYTLYGVPTKAGVFTVTAAHKRKLSDGKTTVSETYTALVSVWGSATEKKIRYTDQAYVATDTKTLTGVTSVSGQPTGIKFDKNSGKLSGTPTKPGVYSVTLTKTDPESPKKTLKEVFLWAVTEGANGGILDKIGWAAKDSAVTVMQGVIQGWNVTVPDGAKVTVSGVPTGLKLAQDKSTKKWTISGTPTKAGNYVVTFKTVQNGVTVTERISIIVKANKWEGTWYGLQKTGYEDASLNATVTVSANGTVKLVLSEGKDSKTVKTTVSAKNLNADGKTATIEVVKNKVQRTFVADFAGETLKIDGKVAMDLCEKAAVSSAADITTFVLEEVEKDETDAYAYVTAKYDAKKGSFTLAGKLWDGTAVKGTTYALDKAVKSGLYLAPVLLTDKAKNVVYLELSDNGAYARVLEDGKKVSIGKDGTTPLSEGYATDDLKSKKYNIKYDTKAKAGSGLTTAEDLVVAADGGVVTLDIPESALKSSVSAVGLAKFTITDANGWKWVCELLPVEKVGEHENKFRGIATGTKKNEKTQYVPVWSK